MRANSPKLTMNTLYDECLYYARKLDMESAFVDGMNEHKVCVSEVTELKNLVRLNVLFMLNNADTKYERATWNLSLGLGKREKL